jgi:hypothetical protein
MNIRLALTGAFIACSCLAGLTFNAHQIRSTRATINLEREPQRQGTGRTSHPLSLSTSRTKDRPMQDDRFLKKLLSHNPLFDSVLSKREALNIQIIYTRIDRDKSGVPHFTDHFFGVDDQRYYYPASTVKLPIAILALQKLNELHIEGLNKFSTMITGADGHSQTPVQNDPTSPDGRPSIAQYIRKILLVSDNDAFNRLYEFLGQEYINNTLHQMGFKDVQIIHRLGISLSEADNRYTNPISFYDTAGQLLYQKPAELSRLEYAVRNTKIGNGYLKDGQLVNEPFDFSKKNRLPLTTLHQLLRAVIFPGSVPSEKRFNLTEEDYQFLRRYMGLTPGESGLAAYDSSEYFDTYVKFMFYGAEKNTLIPYIRELNKPGDAYGFLIDAGYIADFRNNIEFFASAVIYCNSDGILNDDKYDYATIGLPFMKNLGRTLYQYELKRKRKHPADLSGLRTTLKGLRTD